MKIFNNFVVFEGCEGVGKTYHLHLLKAYLNETNQNAVFTREPGGAPVSEKIRNIILSDEMHPLTEAYLFAAQRIEHIKEVILPALEEGKIVVCDRYIDSSIAYQGYARELGREKVEQINSYAQENCMPGTVIFIDLAFDKSWRKQSGGVIEDDRMEKESTIFHQKVYKGFEELAALYPRYVKIKPDIDKNITQENIRRALRERSIIK